MRIKDVRAYTVRVPLEKPVQTSNLKLTERCFVLAEIETVDGSKGYGYGFTRDGLVAESIVNNLRPLLIGRDAHRVEKLWDDMVTATRYLGRRGLLVRAISAVDIALWDLKGKAAGLPLWKLLGGFEPQVKAYVAGGYYRQGQKPGDLKDEFARYREAGFHGAKLNVGGATVDEDLRRVEAARSGLGDDRDLMVDFNGSLAEVKPALSFARRLEPYGIRFIEEPFRMERTEAMRQFRAGTTIPVAVGEDESGRWAFKELMSQSCLDIVRHDATLAGGISEWLKITHLAQAFELPVFAHWFPEIHLQLAAACSNCTGVELIAPESGIMNFHRLVLNPVEQKDGYATASEEPGLGLQWDWDAIRRFTI